MASSNFNQTYCISILTVAIILLCESAQGGGGGGAVPAVYVFGDSLADVGNNNHLPLSLLKANFPHNGVDYPGRKATGRFSNGRNFADFLAENLGVETSPPYLSLSSNSNHTSVFLTGVNFASGGAGILSSTNSGKCISFDQQIAYYSTVYGGLVQQLGTAAAQDHLSKSVFAIVIGSNELLNYAKSNSASKPTPQQFVDSVMPTLQGQLKRMYNLGARRFAFMGTGPIGCCPALREQNKTKECNAGGNYASVLYNRAVSSFLNEMSTEFADMSYSFLDTYSVLLQYIQQPSTYGFTEVKSACCGLGDLNAKVACLPVATYCSNRASHIFWDFYHPTEATAMMVVNTAFAPAPAPHPDEDDWSFLTDQFISATSLSPSPSSNPFLDPSLPSDSSTNPFLTPPPATSAAPSLSLPHRSVSLSAPAPIRGSAAAGSPRSASLSLPDPPTVRSAPPPGRSDSLEEDSGYWTPPSEPYRSASSLSLSSSPPCGVAQWDPPPGEQHAGSLPEFSGRATSDPIFQPAARTAVDSTRPVPLTVRPRPPRETQRGFAIKSIVFFPPSHLWAGHESGVRVWNVDRLFDDMPGRKAVRRGDEESAPFVESTRTTPVVSLVVDTGRGVVWSGHVDGRIMAWRADGPGLVDGFMDCIAWDAHQKVPVLSMVLTSYGELWSGSEGGIIKVWSAEAIKESLSLRKEEKHKATFLLDRTCLDLRTLVSDGGSCPLPVVDIKFLLSDNSGSRVWCGGYLSFVLWDCRTKELLKIISSIDGQVENRFDLSPQDPYFRKEKSRGPTSFFQRSRNAIMGAADTFKRVAVKAAFGDDIRRIEAVAMSAVGTIWAGSANGAISYWDPNGHRLNEFQHNSASILCICAHGTRVWVGYSDGTLQIMDLNGKLLSSWVAHKSPIMKIAVGGTQIFTLAHHGGIRGWSLSSPGPIDSIVRADLAQKEAKYKRLKHFKVVTGTWNVGQEKASNDSIRAWLGVAVKEEVELVVVGLQEVDMGAGFLAMAAARETVGFEGSPSPNGEWWLDAIERVLGRTHFERIGCRQFASLLIAVWARKTLKQYLGDVESAAVACGLGRAIANKGGVGFRMRIYGRTMCFVNCHLAAHLEGVTRRNEDFDYIYRSMTFTSAGTSAGPNFRGANMTSNKKPDLSESDMVIFLGDFNYRLDGITYEDAMTSVYQKDFDKLRQRDQLRAEMRGGRVFQGLREGSIKFPATYKFEKYVSGLSGYDSSEKKRIPAWCDRILYRDSRTTSGDQCSLDCPIVSSVSLYDSCMEATDSDHKPVKCMLNVDIAHVDERVRRQEFREIISTNTRVQSLIEELKMVPECSISTNSVTLQNGDTSVIRVVNKNRREKAVFDICSSDTLSASSEHQHGRGYFPKWLKVNPTSGIINPGQTAEIKIQCGGFSTQDFYDGFPANRQKEENRERIAILLIKVTANYSTEARTYLINVSHTGSNRAFSSRNTQYNYSGYR